MLALPLLAYVAVAQFSNARGPTFKLDRADLSSPPAFVIYGDMRFTRWRFAGNASSAWARQALVQQIASEKPDALFLNGDLPYRGADFGDYEVFEKETRIWRELSLRLYPVLGNHEFYNRDLLVSRGRGLANWWKEFPVVKGLEWYSVQLGDHVYVLCLDSNFGALQAGGPQRVWLERQLSDLLDSIDYVFFVLHHARAGDYLESGSGGFDRNANEDDLEIYLEHLERRSHARFVVVAGHDHNYGRMERNGVVYIVSGGGGAHPVIFRRQREDSFKGKDLMSGGKPLPNYHYIKFVLGSNLLTSTMVRISNPEAGHGATWDSPDKFVITPHTKVH
jgi:hypothetical protein